MDNNSPNPSSAQGTPLQTALIETLKDGEDTGKSVMSLIGGISGAVAAHLTNLSNKDALIVISAGSLIGWAYGRDIWSKLFNNRNKKS